MSVTEGFVRPETVDKEPPLPGGEHILAAPEEIPRKTPVSPIQVMMPIVLIVLLVGMVIMMFSFGGMGSRAFSPYMLFFPVMMVIAVMSMASHTVGGGSQVGELNEDRKDYLRYLGIQRQIVQKTGREQHAARSWHNPELAFLPSLAGSSRKWERNPGSTNFAQVRVGLGTEKLATKLVPPEAAPVDNLEPVAARFLKRFVDTHKNQTSMPLAVALGTYPYITVTDSDGKTARGLVRSMLLQLTLFHGPDHLLVVVITDKPDDPLWSWVKWLPHNQHPTATDALGTARMVYPDTSTAHEALRLLLDNREAHKRQAATAVSPHLVIVSDRPNPLTPPTTLIGRDGLEGVTLIDLQPAEPGPTGSGVDIKPFTFTICDGLLYVADARGVQTKFAVPDYASLSFAADYARILSRYRPASEMDVLEQRLTRKVVRGGVWEYLGVPDVATADPKVLQRRRDPRDFLKVKIGEEPSGVPVYWDLKETGLKGNGPHGIVIGATGSGKSETLRTLVLSLLGTHPSDLLNLLLIDYKGGVTFLGFDQAPHTAAVLTNMEAESHLVSRMNVALRGEINRRQEIIREAQKRLDIDIPNVIRYNELRDAGYDLVLLPTLLILVDEFSALLGEHPEFADLFALLGQQGRSLGMHLLLASQELAQGRLSKVEAHLSYRFALRTNSPRESRDVIHTPDAADLPPTPGAAFYLASGHDLRRINVYYTGDPYVPPRKSAIAAASAAAQQIADAPRPRLFTASPVAPDTVPEVAAAPGPVNGSVVDKSTLNGHSAAKEASGSSQHAADREDSIIGAKTKAQVFFSRFIGHGPDAHRIWLPPLNTARSLKDVINDPDLRWPESQRGPLQILLGVIDTPYYQRRDALTVDLKADNILVVGSQHSGRSTMLQTLIMSAASTHDSTQIQFYCLDFSTGSLEALEGLAHVGSVAAKNQPEKVSRTIAEMTAIWNRREQLFREKNVKNMADFRRRKAQGDPSLKSDKHGDVVLIIDGWTTITRDDVGFDHLEHKVNILAAKAKSFGIHVVLTADRYMDYKPAIKDMLGYKLEFHINDAASSEVHRKAAEALPKLPGRGIVKSTRVNSGDDYNPEILDFLVALPMLTSSANGVPLSTSIDVDLRDSIAHINGANRFKAPEVRLLPEDQPRAEFMAKTSLPAPPPGRAQLVVPIGLGETDMLPQYLDFNDQSDAHFVAITDMEKGKTTILRHIITTLCEQNPPGGGADEPGQSVLFLVVDFQRRLLGVLPSDQYGKYVSTEADLRKAIDYLLPVIDERMPRGNLTPGQVRRRDWWSGPDIFVVVDNAHEFAGMGHALFPLKKLLANGRDTGLHVVTSWRTGGVSNHIYNPNSLLYELKNLNTPALVGSGSKDEGVLFGVKPTTQKPGRGILVTKRGAQTELIQVPHLPAPDDE